MSNSKISEEKKLIKRFIDGDDDALKLLSKEQLEKYDLDISEVSSHEFTNEQFKELKRRSYEFKNGIGKTYTWEETVAATDKIIAEQKKVK